MDAYTVTDHMHTYTRISTAKARKLWGTVDIALCPVNLRPGYPWASHITVRAFNPDVYSYNFDDMVRDFEGYNCTMNETGYYTAFYLVEERTCTA